MNAHSLARLERAIANGNAILFLGAGASAGSLNSQGEPLLSTTQLAEILATESGISYTNESLDEVYAAAKHVLGTNLSRILEQYFRHCRPSDDYIALARFPWMRVYTTNIDDAFERALEGSEAPNPQRVRIQTRKSQFVDRDQTYSQLDLVKLHGSIDRLHEGVVFSPIEYAIEAANPSPWYSQLGYDYQNYSFIIIGSSLKEPLFYHQVQYAREKIRDTSPQSYLIIPCLSEIQRIAFTDNRILHIKWTLTNFMCWMQKQFPTDLDFTDVAANNNPSIRKLMTGRHEDLARRAKALSDVLQVQPTEMRSADLQPGRIRNFYRGFKPTWSDIADGIPAHTDDIENLAKKIRDALSSKVQCVVVYGPAGSGKSTACRLAAFQLVRTSAISCYFTPGTNEHIVSALEELEAANEDRYIVICDRLEPSVGSIVDSLQKNKFPNLLILAVESQHAWSDRIRAKFVDVSIMEYDMSRISKGDVTQILSKLEQFGPWTLLARSTPRQREHLLYKKSRRQLLIGLLEATQGMGFEEIIERDYRSLTSDDHRILLVVVGLASIHRLYLPITYAARALENLAIQQSPAELLVAMEGILYNANGRLFARHPVYVRSLIESHIDTNELADVVEKLIHVFTNYRAPVIKSLTRNESHLYKKTINNRFLRGILRNSERRILGIYQSLEKYFEQDGLYWLQYGLALRHFGHQGEALEKLQTAVAAHEQAHTLHAFAHQQLIMAMEETDLGRSERLAEEARGTLERLHDGWGYSDLYPINLLARGYTAFVRKVQGDVYGRIVAREYADRIYATNRTRTDPHLGETWAWLTAYAVNGHWEASDLSDIITVEEL